MHHPRADTGIITDTDIDAIFRQRHAATLWMRVACVMLGAWLLASTAMADYADSALVWNDAITGAMIVAFGVASLYPAGDTWGRWGLCGLGLWLWLAPLVFHAPAAFTYANDTLTGALVVALSVLAPGVPGKAHLAATLEPGPQVPPGWSYNPSTWGQRAPIIVLALLSFLIGRYMTAFQLGHISTVWDPFFSPGTSKVLTSDVSKAFPIPDAGLGSVSYLLEGLSGFMGGTARWRTLPWMVILFGIMIVPLGIVSIALVVMQPVIVGAWCTLCLLTALFMLVMIPMAIDEVWATLQFLGRVRRRGDSPWRALWIGDAIAGEPARPEPFTIPAPSRLLSGLVTVKVPWTLIASILTGFWLMASPAVFDITGRTATSHYLTGPLVAVVAATAMAEIARGARYLNLAFGTWLVAAPFVLGGATDASTVNCIAAGLLLIALSLPRGEVRDRYAGWQPYIV